jgi:hypothetical protein
MTILEILLNVVITALVSGIFSYAFYSMGRKTGFIEGQRSVSLSRDTAVGSAISFFSMGYKAGVAKGRCEGFIEGQPSMTISKGTNVCFGYESLIHSKGGSENVHFPKEEDK